MSVLLFPYSVDWLLPGIDLGTCYEGEDLLKCTGGSNTRAYTDSCAAMDRPHLVVTCDATFTGVAASCADHADYPIKGYAEPPKRLAQVMEDAHCAPNTEDPTAQFPAEILSCPSSSTGTPNRTACSSLHSKDLYDRLVANKDHGRVSVAVHPCDDGTSGHGLDARVE